MLVQFYILFVFLITVAIILLSIVIGWCLAGYTLRRNSRDQKRSLGSIVGAMLGLLGFILAFTFSITSSRHAARKQLVLKEANAIGTAVLRTDFLPEPSRTESRQLFQEYVNIRVEARQNPEKISQAIADSEVIHDRLWSQVTDRPFSGSGTTLVVAEQLNRKWLGCEVCPEYNQWAIPRLENVKRRTKEEWIAFDRENEQRRNSIR